MAKTLDDLKKELEAAEAALQIQRSIMFEGQKPTATDAIRSGVAQGLSFGFEDDLQALLSGVGSAITTPGSLSERGEAFDLSRRATMADSLRQREAISKEFPKLNFASELGGGAVSGGALFGRLNSALSNTPTFPRILGIGATEGGLFGAGMAPPDEKGMGALVGGATGAVGTPIGLGVSSVLAVPLRAAARRLGESLLGTPRDRAIKEIVRALDADDITVREADALIRQLGRNATIADLGDSTARLGRVVTSEMGQGASRATRFLDARQRASQMELMQAARRATGARNFDRGVIEVINGAESAAEPIYREVYSQVLDVTSPMLDMLNRPAMLTARRKAAQLLRNEGFSSEIVDDVTDVRYMDAVKRALDDMEGAALRAGNRNQARVLGNLRRDFVAEIDAQVPRYAEARSVFAGEAAMRDAAETGRNLFVGRRYSVADASEVIGRMGESELQAARLGFIEWLTDELAEQSVSGNTLVNKFADRPKFRQIVQQLFPDQNAVNEFIGSASALSRFGRTRNTITGGSPTSRIQSDRGTMQQNVLDVAVNSALEPTSGIRGVIQLIKGNTKITPDTLEAIGEILFNPNIIPSQALRRGPVRFTDIPTLPPTTAAGAAGGAIGSQQDILFGLLGEPLRNILGQ